MDRMLACSHNGIYDDHMDVAVRELKAKLSAYLARASAGEVLTVTDRGRPIAVLGPPLGRVDLSAAIEAGWVTAASKSGLGPVRRWPGRGPVLDALAEDRGE
ncbi:MAG: type II toxin-antitoxin system Phd/YefM family antitoxin [Acidimicrobiia bacterium]